MNNNWNDLKEKYYIGKVFESKVLEVAHFGVFIDLGYGNSKSKEFTGIVDILTKGENGIPLPIDRPLWPKENQIVKCKVMGYRDKNKEIDLLIMK